MDLTERAEHQAQQATSEATRLGFQLTLRIMASNARQLAAGLHSLRDSAQQQNRTSQQTVVEFARTNPGSREVVELGDRRLADEAAKVMRSYGVNFAMTKQPDGGAVLHVSGKDAKVVAHALGKASEHVDRKLALNATKKAVGSKIQQRVAQKVAARVAAPPVQKLAQEVVRSATRGLTR